MNLIIVHTPHQVNDLQVDKFRDNNVSRLAPGFFSLPFQDICFAETDIKNIKNIMLHILPSLMQMPLEIDHQQVEAKPTIGSR